MITGANVHSRFGNVNPAHPIPAGYILKSPGALDAMIQELWSLKIHARLGRVRTLLWLAERDPVETPWLHVPLLPEEVDLIRRMARNSPIPVEIAWGPLWEARWMQDEIGIPIPDNPFVTVLELFDAMKQSLWPVLFNSDGSPALSKHTRLDIFSEFDLSDTQEPIMALWYPWARDACRQAGIESTVSVIVPVDCFPDRALASYDWLAGLGAGLPSCAELHINGVPDSAIIDRFEWVVEEMRDAYGLPITIGEDDQIRGGEAMAVIAGSGCREYLSW